MISACSTGARGAGDAAERTMHITAAQFRHLLDTVAAGWNEGDSRKAANCFAVDAIYQEPPDRQLYRGREALFDFFGGAEQPPSPGRMRWHHVVFDETAQIGAGEYTYQGRNRYHGIVIVRIEKGLISRWREYQYESRQSWEEFVGPSRF